MSLYQFETWCTHVSTHSTQAARLSKNCEQLLALIKKVDAQLARVLDSIVRKRVTPPSSVEGALLELVVQVAKCGRLMKVGRGRHHHETPVQERELKIKG